jgi:DNA-directed RNA polymerase subunit RPC12/RpoP
VIRCAGCGAEFTLPPQTLSCACPFCGSALAVQQREARELIPPDGIIPFAISRDDARARLLQELQAERLEDCAVEPPAGFYLPVWAFRMAGEVAWRGEVRQKGQARRIVSGRHAVMQMALVPAARELPPDLAAVVDGFRLEDAAAYDPRYLADWPAETYEISVSDASLEARRIALARLRADIADLADEAIRPDAITVSPIGLAVESFRLLLVPVWLIRFTCDGERFAAAVNGQTGEVRAQRPLRGIARWLKGLLG